MATATSYEKQGLLHDIFENQAKITPDNVAVVDEWGNQITYKGLDVKSEILGRHLVHIGVKPNDCVGLYLNLGIEYTTAYIAILKAGAAYLPLDISVPKDKLKVVLDDANPTAIITTEDYLEILEGCDNIVSLEEGWDKRFEIGEAYLPSNLTLDNLAYIVYSSGTTGKPKGILCPHRGAVFSYHWRHEAYPYIRGEKVACNIFFTWEMLRPLLKGATLYIIPNNTIYDPSLLCGYLYEHRITQILFTPSLLEAILNTPSLDLQQQLRSLRQIWLCGEVVTTALFEKCLALLPWIQFVNLYSVSECHDVACEDLSEYFKDNEGALKTRKLCPFGRILPGVNLVILGKNNKVKPVGTSGEIFVGGPTLARGYLHKPEDEACKFIPLPPGVQTSHGDRLFRTGDWGYISSDGRLEICGRHDSMIQIKGYSIEVQAVEHALMELPMVKNCAVVVKGQEGEENILVSYIVPEGQTTKKDIRALLKLRLPFYMIPSYFVFLDSIPTVEGTGKRDKKALPEFVPNKETDSESIAAPSTEMEKQMSKIWSKVLKLQDIDVQDSFFDLGGHSLQATELATNIKKTFDIDLNMKDLFSYPTITMLSQFIEAKKTNTLDTLDRLPKLPINLKTEVHRNDPQDIVNIDMQLRAFWRPANISNYRTFKEGRVLLTGATGCLGAFILKELLLQTKSLIVCLVRGLPGIAPTERILKALKQFGSLPGEDEPTEEQTLIQSIISKRVTVVVGDVALRNLGMSEDDYSLLCDSIDYIIHAAAYVNLIYPYAAFAGPNVTGTRNIIMFSGTGKIKPIHYISTDSVFPMGMKDCSENDNAENYYASLTSGYAQSKWVAEQLIAKAGQKGLPVAIYRLGNMSGDRKKAYWNPQDLTLMIMQVSAKFGLAPDVDWDMEMTPVDFAAEFIVRCTYNLEAIVGKTYHIINDAPLPSRWTFEWMNAHGFPLQIVPYKQWRTRTMKQLAKRDNEKFCASLQRMLDSYLTDASFFSNLCTYQTENLKQALDWFYMSYPYTDSYMLDVYFTALSERNIVAPCRRSSSYSENRKLEGQVAIVTGASSAIGRAISIALSLAGARVALAARRTERLEKLNQEITEQGGICIIHQTDVTNREEVKELVTHTEEVLGTVDILVNNAGVMYYDNMKELNGDEWDRQIDINCKGVANCIGAVLDGMLDRGTGHIVNMSSDAGRKGFPGLAVYSGTKFFVEGLSQALRKEVCGSGIRVTCIQPGDVQIKLQEHAHDNEAQKKYAGSLTSKILDPADIAHAVFFAVTQPDHVSVNEILVEPSEAPV